MKTPIASQLIRYVSDADVLTLEGLKLFRGISAKLDWLEDLTITRTTAQTGGAEIEALVLTDAYQDLVLSGPVLPADADGVHMIVIRALVTGTTGGSDMQFRVLENGVPGHVGNIIAVGNRTLSVSASMFASVGVGITLQARGTATTIDGGHVASSRIGFEVGASGVSGASSGGASASSCETYDPGDLALLFNTPSVGDQPVSQYDPGDLAALFTSS